MDIADDYSPENVDAPMRNESESPRESDHDVSEIEDNSQGMFIQVIHREKHLMTLITISTQI